ncbi:MAG: dTDP-4-dehydrorhamnose 3,5-epimerase family protein [Chloroflexota bacterium]
MDQGWQSTHIAGVLRRKLVPHEDERGVLREAWRASWAADLGIGPVIQANDTVTRAGALRGMHLHLRQTDVWVVISGNGHAGLADVRPLLAGEKLDRPNTLSLELTDGDCLVIPTGVGHGLWALTDVTLLYIVTVEYDGTDEHGFAWNDPMVALAWPGATPILSERDRSAPLLSEAVNRLGADPA